MRNPGTGEATWRARLMGRAAEASANVPSALIIRLPVDPKETNQKLLKVSLRSSYKLDRPACWGVNTHCRTPQPQTPASQWERAGAELE